MEKEKDARKEIQETFISLGNMLSQACSAAHLVSPALTELLGKAKDYSHMLDDENFEIRLNEDFRLDIRKAIDAIENCRSDVIGGEKRDVWLNKARERILKVNDDLKDWAD